MGKLLLLILTTLTHYHQTTAHNNLWPIPTSQDLGTSGRRLEPSENFTIKANLECGRLENGIARYLPLFTNPEKSNNAGFRGGSYGGVYYGGGGSITGLELTVGSCEETLSFSTDTSYEITTSDDMEVVSISSKTIYGVMYGMESLSQLI